MKYTFIFLLMMTGFSTLFSQSKNPFSEENFELNKWAESEYELTQFLKDFPVHPDRLKKLWQLSQIYIQKNRYFEAESLLTEISQNSDGILKSKSEYWLAKTDLDYDKLPEALSHLEKCISGNQNLEEIEHAHVLRAYVLSRLERWKAAELAAKEFLEKYPESFYANYASLVISESYFHQQQYDQTIDEVQLLIPLLNSDEEIERSLLLLAESYARKKRWKDAIIFYGRLENEYPNSFQIDWIRFRLAYALMSDGQRKKAETEIEKISQNSFLLPFKKALQIEIWKYNGSLDKIVDSDFQVLSGQPLLSVYNLNHRIWAASKLERWDVYKKDLQSMEKQPLLFMPLDSLWAQLGQLSFENKNFSLSGEAYQRAISFNKKLNKSVWPEIYYNAGLAFFSNGKFTQAKLFFDEFIQRFSGNTLAGDAFVYSLQCMKNESEFDSALVRIQKDRDKYPNWYDLVDLMNAEMLFETGKEKEGFDLFEKKIRYAQSDSMKVRSIYLAAKSTLMKNRPDLALAKLRILNRFYPQYFPAEVDLMQIIGEFQIQSYAYLTERIHDYRSKFGISGDQILIPIEIQLSGKKGELKPELINQSISRLTEIGVISFTLGSAKNYLDSVGFSKVMNDAKLKTQLIQFGEEGIFILSYQFPVDVELTNSITKEWSERFQRLRNFTQLRDSSNFESVIEDFRRIRSDWIRQHLLIDFLKKNKIDLMKKMLDENEISYFDIDILKQNCSWETYANFSQATIQFLLSEGSKPTPQNIKLHFYGGVSKFYETINDTSLSTFYLGEALKNESISLEYIDLQTNDIISDAAKNWWDSVEEKKDLLTSPLPEYVEKKLSDMKLNFDFQQLSVDDFIVSVKEYSEKYSNDEVSVEQAFLLQIKKMVAEKKNKKLKKNAKTLVSAFVKKNPKSKVNSELKKLVR